MLETKQLYEGAEKTPFYPKVPLQALDGIAPNTTLEDNIKTISKTVYGTETPGKTSSTSSIDTVPEVYDFLSGYNNLQKLSDLINVGGGSGSNVSISNTYNYGTKIATVKIDGSSTNINVPSSVVYDFMGSSNLWKLVYDPDTTLLKLIFNQTPIANVYLGTGEASSLYLKPSAPTNVLAEYNSSANIITVSWNPVWENHTEGINESYVPTYEIQKYINGDAVGERITVSDGNTTYLDANIIANATYEYVIYARSVESTLLSDPSVKSNPVVTSSDEDDATKSIEIDFADDQVSNYSYAGGEYTNILRQMGSVETYNGIVTVCGSMATLNKVSYAKVLNFDGEELTVSLGAIRSFGNTYCKEGTVAFTRNNKDVPLNTTLALYAMPPTGDTYIVYGYHTYNFVYPIYTGYVEESMWDEAVLNNNVDSSVTVINHGNALNDADPVGLTDGYLINNATFTCNLTTSQKEDSNFTKGYVQIAIPLNLHYMGYGVTTDPDNMPTVFKTTGALETTIPGMEKASKHIVSAKGITYWVYTASTSSQKALISSNGSTLKAIV